MLTRFRSGYPQYTRLLLCLCSNGLWTLQLGHYLITPICHFLAVVAGLQSFRVIFFSSPFTLTPVYLTP